MSDLSISYGGEASESFANAILNMKGLTVQVTPQDGRAFRRCHRRHG
jgi:endonuclease YncB( thermonuclease family)